MTDAPDPFEERLAAELRASVAARTAPGGLLDRARARHRVRQRARRVKVATLAAAAALLVGFLAVSSFASARQDEVRAVDRAPTSTTDTSTTTTTTESPAALPPSPTSTAPTTTTRPAPTPGCAKATGDPEPPMEQWAEWYSTEPGPNQPATILACIDNLSPAVGELVTINLVGDDPDAVIVDRECGWEVVWVPREQPNLCRDYILLGEEKPPAPEPEPGHIERSSSHAFELAGTYLVRCYVWSADYDARPHPYSSRVEVSFEVTVRP